ncbi:MAG TPA: response regulator [Rhodocyclaceae bacterium]|nr:response regulator [Rhodocyclaceae bacterium]
MVAVNCSVDDRPKREKAVNRTILLVEDNPDDEFLALRALHKNNVANEVIVARDGLEALEYLFGEGARAGKPPLQPEVILLDLKLPKIDGIEVLRRVRADERTRRIPTVILTTSGETVDIEASYDNGCNSYIRKPVDFEQFIEAVRQLGLYWLVLNKTAQSDTLAS